MQILVRVVTDVLVSLYLLLILRNGVSNLLPLLVIGKGLGTKMTALLVALLDAVYLPH